MSTHRINIAADGTLVFLYDDELTFLNHEGRSHTRRASHVEPKADEPGSWLVDFAPIGWPKIGVFPSRGAALEAEKNALTHDVGVMKLLELPNQE